MGSLDVLTPDLAAGLFYGDSGSTGTNSTDNSTSSGTVAKLTVTFLYPSVALDHSIYITSSCSGGQLFAVFNSSAAFAQAQNTWPSGGSFVLITAAASCGNGIQNSFFLANEVDFSASDTTAIATGSIVDLVDIFDDLGLDFGAIPANATANTNSTVPAYVCGSPDNSTIDGLPAVPCGLDFDQTLDDYLGYYSGADSDIPVRGLDSKCKN